MAATKKTKGLALPTDPVGAAAYAAMTEYAAAVVKKGSNPNRHDTFMEGFRRGVAWHSAYTKKGK